MKIVVFGLTLSSTWGNGHASLWRPLCKALSGRGHRVVFFERDVPYYAASRDFAEMPGGELILYREWTEALWAARRHLADADVAIVTSYCPDAVAATNRILDSSKPLRVFYDLDTPQTLARLEAGEAVEYLGSRKLADFDLVLSCAGGRSLDGLRTRAGARRVAALYGSVDPAVHRPARPDERYRSDLGYLGAPPQDRSKILRAVFVDAATRLPDRNFLIAGSTHHCGLPRCENVRFVDHVATADQPAFYSSSRLSLHLSQPARARVGYCPSERLFEAAACGAAILTDYWDGVEQFFDPGAEILVAHDTWDVMAALASGQDELTRMARAARERTLAEHTADVRARQLECVLDAARGRSTFAIAGDAY